MAETGIDDGVFIGATRLEAVIKKIRNGRRNNESRKDLEAVMDGPSVAPPAMA